MRDPELSIDNFRRQLKTFLFAQYWRWHPSALGALVPVRSINLLFTLFTLHHPTVRQENCAIAKMTARYALYTSASHVSSKSSSTGSSL